MYKGDGCLSLARLRDAAGQLLQGLAAMHAASLVHRDIKPSNVILTVSGSYVLIDLGLAAGLHQHSAAGSLAGTVRYLSPERARGERAMPTSDLYALGVCLKTMGISGRRSSPQPPRR